MITALLAPHIVLMVASLVLTSASALLAFAGYRIPRKLYVANMIGTVTGVSCGVVLAFSLPIDARCLVLIGYVVAFTFAQAYVLRRNQELSASAGV